MSRVSLTPKNPKHEVVIGLDRPTGWLTQVFDGVGEEGEDVLIVDRDTLFDRTFNRQVLCDLIEEYAEDNSHCRHCITQILFDLDPAL